MAFVETDSELGSELASIIEDEELVLYDAFVGDVMDLKVYISAKEHKGVVTSGDCSRVCKRLVTFFAAEGGKFNIPEDVRIEVSTPGINRSLRLKKHFESAVGERVRITSLGVGHKGTKSNIVPLATGCLCRLESDGIIVEDEQTSEEVVFPFDSIKSARVDFKFDTFSG